MNNVFLNQNTFCRVGIQPERPQRCAASVGIGVGYWRTLGVERRITRRGVGFFALVRLRNGFAVLCWVQSLALGPVSLISPIVACYPVFTLLFGAVLLRQTAIAGNRIVGVIPTVLGIVLLTGG